MTLQESISYYRSCLSDSSRTVYDGLYREIQKDTTTLNCQLPAPYKCSIDDCTSAYTALAMDHPELYLLQYEVVIGMVGNIVSFQNKKSISKNVAERIDRELQICISEITRGLRSHTEFEKEFIIYTRITKMLSYSCKEKATHSILSPVLAHKGSCDGRSKLLALCLRAVGIPCIIAREEGHMWNMASIDGHNVWLDCTYETIQNGRLAYFYYNLDDRQLKVDHAISPHLPKCTDNGYDFFSKFGLAFRTRQEVIEYIHAEYQSGTDTISFKLIGADEKALISVIQEGLPKGAKGCSYSLNQSQNAVILSFSRNE